MAELAQPTQFRPNLRRTFWKYLSFCGLGLLLIQSRHRCRWHCQTNLNGPAKGCWFEGVQAAS